MMNSRERVYATLDFQGPDRLPRQQWAVPGTWIGREEAVTAVKQRFPVDIAGAPYRDPMAFPQAFTKGTFVDAWGCEWVMLQEGIAGEVKRSPLEDYDRLSSYRWPKEAINHGWEETAAGIAANREKFILAGGFNPFERMQFLRGPENLYLDLADEECSAVYELRDRLFAFYRQYVERWVTYDVDGILFSDDWGSQRSLLISPAKWREFFKPKYKELFDIVLDAGKRVFLHSDGYIADIYPDWIQLGVSAINSQVWCMGLATLQPFAGKITFWGELDRQHLLPHGTPAEIRQAAQQMVTAYYRNGGLIGQCEVDQLTPLENIEASLSCWLEITLPGR